jgi:hypothetical protein
MTAARGCVQNKSVSFQELLALNTLLLDNLEEMKNKIIDNTYKNFRKTKYMYMQITKH